MGARCCIESFAPHANGDALAGSVQNYKLTILATMRIERERTLNLHFDFIHDWFDSKACGLAYVD